MSIVRALKEEVEFESELFVISMCSGITTMMFRTSNSLS